MNRGLHPGGWPVAKAVLATAAMVCLCPVGAISTGAQATSSPSGTTTSQVPAAPIQPNLPPPAAAPSVPAPASPSMMPVVSGTPLDRVVAIVNDELILDSDVDQELRLQAFDPYRAPSEPMDRERAIERLINRALILQQLKLEPEAAPTDAEVNKQIDQLRRDIPACSRYRCETKAGWDHFLADHGFTEASLFELWKQRMTVLDFIEERFQIGINITPAQIQSYYEKTLLPVYRQQHAPAPKLETISGQIREVLLQQQISNLLRDWLQSLRAQGSVVVLHPGEEAP